MKNTKTEQVVIISTAIAMILAVGFQSFFLFPAIKPVNGLLLSICAAKLKTALLKIWDLRAANDSKRAVNALTALQLIGSRFIIR